MMTSRPTDLYLEGRESISCFDKCARYKAHVAVTSSNEAALWVAFYMRELAEKWPNLDSQTGWRAGIEAVKKHDRRFAGGLVHLLKRLGFFRCISTLHRRSRWTTKKRLPILSQFW